LKDFTALCLFVFSIFQVGCTNREQSDSKNEVEVFFSEKSFIVSNQTGSEPLLPPWRSISTQDPNSGERLKYSGYDLAPLLEAIAQKFEIQSLAGLKIIAKDGYVLRVSVSDIKKKGAFLALEVSGIGPQGIYNKSLKDYFDWRPGYVIFLKSAPDSKTLSSPYQIVKIQLETSSQSNSKGFLSSLESPYREGAQIFLDTCNKCHSYQGEGGMKAPPIGYLTVRWKSDGQLKDFLRDPQKISGRKIGMSAFEGSEIELKRLLQFLRYAEKQ